MHDTPKLAPAPPTCCCSSPVSAATNGRSSLASSIHRHRQSHMRKEAACKANSERRDSTTRRAQQHPTAHFRALSFFCSLLSLTNAPRSHVCERACEWEYVRVCSTHTRACTHRLTEGGDRFVFVGFNGAALCVPACVCVRVTMSVCGWLANNKNEECRHRHRSAFGREQAQYIYVLKLKEMKYIFFLNIKSRL